jgi:hypothetical protein
MHGCQNIGRRRGGRLAAAELGEGGDQRLRRGKGELGAMLWKPVVRARRGLEPGAAAGGAALPEAAERPRAMSLSLLERQWRWRCAGVFLARCSTGEDKEEG